MTTPELPFDPGLLPEREGVYLVGGAARDVLLGLTPVDYDIAVSRNPEQFARLTAALNHGRLVQMGRPGKTSFRVLAGRMVLDITGLSGPTIDHDLENRDVTINAMAIDLSSGKLLDRLGGRKDLAEKRIRMVSDGSFVKDPIRLLRVFRLAAALGFSIETRTRLAISRDASLIRVSAWERIRSELFAFFSCKQSFPLLLEMADTGLLASVFPELTRFRYRGCRENGPSCLLEHALSIYKQLENLLNTLPPGFSFKSMEAPASKDPLQSARLKCAALLHPLGKPMDSARPSWDDPQPGNRKKLSSAPVATVCRRLRLSSKEQHFVTGVVQHGGIPRRLYEAYCNDALDPLAITRFFMKGNASTPHILLYALAEAQNNPPRHTQNKTVFQDFARQLLVSYYGSYLTRKKMPPLVTGRDLMCLFELPPSPAFKKILARLEEERLSGSLTDRESALAMTREMIRNF